jgi:hypothetical protein
MASGDRHESKPETGYYDVFPNSLMSFPGQYVKAMGKLRPLLDRYRQRDALLTRQVGLTDYSVVWCTLGILNCVVITIERFPHVRIVL